MSSTVAKKSPSKSSTEKPPSPLNSARANGLSRSPVTQQQQVPIRSLSQSNSPSPQQKQRSRQPICPWSARTPLLSDWPDLPFVRDNPALSTTATTAGELFLFGGYIHNSESASNDLYMISTRNFFTNRLTTSGDVPNPRYGHGTALTSTVLLVLGGRVTSMTRMRRKKDGHDNALYLLNLGTSDLLMSRPTPMAADQNFF